MKSRAFAGLVAVGILVLWSCSSGDGNGSGVGSLPDQAQEIIDSDPYRFGRWSWTVTGLDNGDELLASDADVMSLLGSTTKTFTVGTYYQELGADSTLETPVYAVGQRTGGALDGNLVLVGAGDFILGSRGVEDGDVQFNSQESTGSLDHVYFYSGIGAVPVEDDPLAGLDDLARQVAAAGITSVNGDVLVDDRLWEPFETKEGVVTPIMVNDNLIDIEVVPGAAAGDAASLEVRPQTAFFEVVNEVTTTSADGTAQLTAEAGEGNQVFVRGEIPADSEPAFTAYFAPDPAAYARALFIEALGRAGVAVSAPLSASSGALPAQDSYARDAQVASLESPPAHTLGKLILKVSHNRGAETFLCLLAVSTGSRDCTDGLAPIVAAIGEAGIEPGAVFIVDGEGSDPNSATPRALVEWLIWASEQPWADVFRKGMPELGEDGKIFAKSGVSAHVQDTTERALILTWTEAGYMETDDEGRVAFAVFVNSGVFDNIADGAPRTASDIEDVLIEIQKSL